MKKLSDFMPKAIERSEVLRTARAQAAMRRWKEVVGEILAAKSEPDRFDRGMLWVYAEGSSWGQEIRLRKSLILSRLNQVAGEDGLFTDLRVGTRKMRLETGITDPDG